MPSALDLSILHSLWAVADRRAENEGAAPEQRLAQALADFKVGYIGSAVLAGCFVIMGAAFGLIQELPNDAVEHRAAPDHRLVIVDQQTHRHHGDAAGLDRHNPLLIAAALHLRCLVSDAQHGGCIRPINIGVQKSDPQAGLGEGAGQIDRDGALADAALASR